MKKILFSIITVLLSINIVNAKSCSLEDQATVNNHAGLVTVSASPLSYTYTSNNSETGEEEETTAYTGMIYVNNVTEDLYITIDDGENVDTFKYSDAINDIITYNTGGMGYVKNYTVNVYATNTNCSKSAIRQLNVTVPRLNTYYSSDLCQENPDYFYCSQFMTVDDITYSAFYEGVTKYSEEQKQKEEENRKSNVINDTTNFIKNYWYIIVIVIVIVTGVTLTIIRIRRKKREKEIV